MKNCKHCHRLLPLDQFYLVRPDKEWRQGRCIDCFKLKNSIYNTATADQRHARDKEKLPDILAKRKERRAANLEKHLTMEAAQRKKHHARILKNQRDYQGSHREQMRAANRESYAKHQETRRTKQKERLAANPSIAQNYCNKRRARLAGAAINDFTAAQWRLMQALYDHCCAYCGTRAKGHLTQDHVLALAKGGDHTWDNIVPACSKCNCEKFTNIPTGDILRFPKPVERAS